MIYSYLLNDGHRLRARLFNLTEFIKNDSVIFEDDFRLHPKHGLTQNLYFIDNDKYAGVPGIDAIDRGRIIFYDRNKDQSTFSALFPEIVDKTLNGYELYTLYFSHIIKHPSKPIFASVMVHFDRLDIMDSSGDLLATSKANNFNEEEITKNPKLTTENGLIDLTMYYQDVKVTEKRIYALYYDQKNSSYGKEYIPTKIRIFDWEGHLLNVLEVPDYLMSFSVDEQRNTIYGVDYFNEGIFKYDITNILDGIQ